MNHSAYSVNIAIDQEKDFKPVQHSSLPDPDRLSVVTAILGLVYIFSAIINATVAPITFSVFNWNVPFKMGISDWVGFLLALLAGLGADWLVQKHPKLNKQRTVQYGILPALTAWALGIILNTFTFEVRWWVVFGMGMLLLIVVYISEYIIVDLTDILHVPATMALIGVSFALFLILCIAISSVSLRLYVIIPTIAIASYGISLHTLYLRLHGQWEYAWAAGISMVVLQLAIAFHYYPFSPLVWGMILTGTSYSLISLADNLIGGKKGAALWLEAVIMPVVLFILTLILL